MPSGGGGAPRRSANQPPAGADRGVLSPVGERAGLGIRGRETRGEARRFLVWIKLTGAFFGSGGELKRCVGREEEDGGPRRGAARRWWWECEMPKWSGGLQVATGERIGQESRVGTGI